MNLAEILPIRLVNITSVLKITNPNIMGITPLENFSWTGSVCRNKRAVV